MKLHVKLMTSYFFGLLVMLFGQPLYAEESSIWAKPIDNSFNFYQITPLLYRSALPDASKVDTIKEYKITTIISFIKDNDKKWLQDNTGIDLISYPVHADRVTDDDVLAVLRVIQTAQQQGKAVLIHCKHGQNRTGIFAAMYRIVIQHWTKEQAVLEMARGGYSNDVDDIDDAIAYIKEANIKKIRSALQNNECSTRKLAFCHLFES